MPISRPCVSRSIRFQPIGQRCARPPDAPPRRIKTRLDQLGPKPDDQAPPESPAVTAERADQQKLYNDTDELLKRAPLLAVQADQTSAKITARRRALFTRSLFARARASQIPPSGPMSWHEAPDDTAAKGLFGEWIDGINQGSMASACRFSGVPRPDHFALSAACVAGAPRPCPQWGGAEPSPFLKILGAWWIALVIAVPAFAMVAIIGLVFQAFESHQCAVATLHASHQRGGDPHRRGGGNSARPVCAQHAQLAPAEAQRSSRGRNRPRGDQPCLHRFGDAPFRSSQRHRRRILAGRRRDARACRSDRGPVMLGIELWRFGSTLNPDDCLGPEVARESDWFDLLRMVSWVMSFIIVISVLIGYAAFGSFLLEQFFWVCAVGCLLFMSIVLPTKRSARALRQRRGSGSG